MAAGVRPFSGDNLYRLCSGIINEPIPALPETVPPGLAAVIRRCLEKEPSRRYQRAGEVRAALEALEPSSAVSIVSAVRENPKFGFARWAAAVAVLTLITAVALWLAKRSHNVPKTSTEAPSQRVQLAVISADTNNVNSQASEEAFDNGLVDTLTSGLTELSERHHLAVIPPSEMRAHHVQTLEAARQEFGVNYGLMLNIQRATGQVMQSPTGVIKIVFTDPNADELFGPGHSTLQSHAPNPNNETDEQTVKAPGRGVKIYKYNIVVEDPAGHKKGEKDPHIIPM
jgi:serine/threonine protein kinase